MLAEERRKAEILARAHLHVKLLYLFQLALYILFISLCLYFFTAFRTLKSQLNDYSSSSAEFSELGILREPKERSRRRTEYWKITSNTVIPVKWDAVEGYVLEYLPLFSHDLRRFFVIWALHWSFISRIKSIYHLRRIPGDLGITFVRILHRFRMIWWNYPAEEFTHFARRSGANFVDHQVRIWDSSTIIEQLIRDHYALLLLLLRIDICRRPNWNLVQSRIGLGHSGIPLWS